LSKRRKKTGKRRTFHTHQEKSVRSYPAIIVCSGFREKPFEQHGPETVHHLGAQAAGLFSLLGKNDRQGIRLEADPAFLTFADLVLQIVNKIL
jgi:hypothetical protein